MKKLLSIITLFLVLVGSVFAENHNKKYEKGVEICQQIANDYNIEVEIKKVLTLKNVGLIELTNFIIISLTLLISYLITLLLNPLAGAIIGITLFEIALIVTSLNAEAFVKEEAH